MHMNKRVVVFLLMTVVMVPVIFHPVIPGALLILLLGVHTRNRLAFACGIIAFIYFVSRYYYDLHQTLLIKSIILFVSGMLFLLAWYLIKKLVGNETV